MMTVSLTRIVRNGKTALTMLLVAILKNMNSIELGHRSNGGRTPWRRSNKNYENCSNNGDSLSSPGPGMRRIRKLRRSKRPCGRACALRMSKDRRGFKPNMDRQSHASNVPRSVPKVSPLLLWETPGPVQIVTEQHQEKCTGTWIRPLLRCPEQLT